jgi:hypothetical protein
MDNSDLYPMRESRQAREARLLDEQQGLCPSKLAVGNIVKVVDSNRAHFDMQGQVVGISEPRQGACVRVWFGREADYLLQYPDNEKARRMIETATVPPSAATQAKDVRTWIFSAHELALCESWKVETLAGRLFGRGMWHTLYVPKHAFVSGARNCDVEGCGNARTAATQRILVNLHGVVCFADVCERHAREYHGKCMDTFPWRKAPTDSRARVVSDR